MIEEEHNQMIGEAAKELRDCRRELACLQTKADGFRRQMASAAKVLEECAAVRHPITPESPSKTDYWPTYQDIVDVFQSCRDVKQRIQVLEERFREWGVLPKT